MDSKKIVIRKTPRHGTGIFARVKIKKAEIIAAVPENDWRVSHDAAGYSEKI
jgi:SET domain-containing protein